MRILVRNLGQPLYRDGAWVERGQTFEATELDLKRWERRRVTSIEILGPVPPPVVEVDWTAVGGDEGLPALPPEEPKSEEGAPAGEEHPAPEGDREHDGVLDLEGEEETAPESEDPVEEAVPEDPTPTTGRRQRGGRQRRR